MEVDTIIRGDCPDLGGIGTSAWDKGFLCSSSRWASAMELSERILSLQHDRARAQDLLRAAAEIAGINEELRRLERITDGLVQLAELGRTEAILGTLGEASDTMSPEGSYSALVTARRPSDFWSVYLCLPPHPGTRLAADQGCITLSTTMLPGQDLTPHNPSGA